MLHLESNVRAEPVEPRQAEFIRDSRSSTSLRCLLRCFCFPKNPVGGNDQSPAVSSTSPRPRELSPSPRPTKVRKTSPDRDYLIDPQLLADGPRPVPVINGRKPLPTGPPLVRADNPQIVKGNPFERYVSLDCPAWWFMLNLSRSDESWPTMGLERVCSECNCRIDSEFKIGKMRLKSWANPPRHRKYPAAAELPMGRGTPPVSPSRNHGDLLAAPPEPDLEECKAYVRHLRDQREAFKTLQARIKNSHTTRTPSYADDHFWYSDRPDSRLARITQRAGGAAQQRALDRRTVVGKWERQCARYPQPRPLLRVWQAWNITRSVLPEHERYRPRVPSLMGPGTCRRRARKEVPVKMTAEQERKIVYWGRCPRCSDFSQGIMHQYY
jgi:hypothetical protein